MFLRVFFFVLIVAAVIVAGGCTANRVNTVGGHEGMSMSVPTGYLPSTLFNDVLGAIELPEAAVAQGDTVVVYRLPGDAPDSLWAGNAVEDWLVNQIREAGATAVENDLCAPAALGGGGEPGPSLLRPTSALGYRIVAAEVWFDSPETGPYAETLVPTHAWLRINLRKVDLATGEITWEDTFAYTTKKDVAISRLAALGGGRNWAAGSTWNLREPEKTPPSETIPEPPPGAVTKTVVGNVTTYKGTLRGTNDATKFDLYTDTAYIEVEFTYPQGSAFYVKVLGKAGEELGEFDLQEGEIIELSGGGLFTLIVHSVSGGGPWTATYTE